jgi:hypothetical protein
MEMTVAKAARHSRLMFAGLFLAIASTTAHADERCQQLEALNQQYAGVSLTATQKALKRKLVGWYYHNCKTSTRRASATGW